MRLVHLTNNKVIIARRTSISGDKMAYTTVTAQAMNIQPTGNSSNEIASGVFGKSFRLYCDGATDLNPGDRLRDEDNNYYTVVSDGVSHRSMGSIDFIVAYVQKTKK